MGCVSPLIASVCILIWVGSDVRAGNANCIQGGRTFMKTSHKELILVARGNFLPCSHPCRQRVRTVVLTSVCLPVLSSSIVCTSMYSFCKHSLRWPCIHGSFATYALYVPNRVRTLSNSSHLHLQGTCSCLTVCRGAVPLCRSEHWWPSGH